MSIEKKKSIDPEYLRDHQTDHLTYLKWDFSIFGNEDDDKILSLDLACAVCNHNVTTVAEKIEVRGRHDYGFTNLGYLIQLGCFRTAPGCIGTQGISHGYSWFRGYSWQIQLCRHCFAQLGWKYMSKEDSFYGLVFKMLRESEPKQEGGKK